MSPFTNTACNGLFQDFYVFLLSRVCLMKDCYFSFVLSSWDAFRPNSSATICGAVKRHLDCPQGSGAVQGGECLAYAELCASSSISHKTTGVPLIPGRVFPPTHSPQHGALMCARAAACTAVWR